MIHKIEITIDEIVHATEDNSKNFQSFEDVLDIKEDEFYGFFGSFESLQQIIWNKFFDNSYGLMQKNKQYASMTNEEKMLTFFFTFFENLTLNRSYVLFIIKEHKYSLEGLMQLKGLRKKFKDFASKLIEERNDEKQQVKSMFQ